MRSLHTKEKKNNCIQRETTQCTPPWEKKLVGLDVVIFLSFYTSWEKKIGIKISSHLVQIYHLNGLRE